MFNDSFINIVIFIVNIVDNSKIYLNSLYNKA